MSQGSTYLYAITLSRDVSRGVQFGSLRMSIITFRSPSGRRGENSRQLLIRGKR